MDSIPLPKQLLPCLAIPFVELFPNLCLGWWTPPSLNLDQYNKLWVKVCWGWGVDATSYRIDARLSCFINLVAIVHFTRPQFSQVVPSYCTSLHCMASIGKKRQPYVLFHPSRPSPLSLTSILGFIVRNATSYLSRWDYISSSPHCHLRLNRATQHSHEKRAWPCY